MAQRLTDTNKWSKKFIKRLPPKYKLLWLYLCDACDHAGIWHYEPEIAELRTGFTYDWDQVLEYMDDKIVVFDDGEKWLIEPYVRFQYKKLNPKDKCHASAMKLLNKYELLFLYEDIIQGHTKGLKRPSQGYKVKVKVKDKVKVNKSSKGSLIVGSSIEETKKSNEEPEYNLLNPPPVKVETQTVEGIMLGVENWIKENTDIWEAKKRGLFINNSDPKFYKSVLHELAIWIKAGHPVKEDALIDKYLSWINRKNRN